MLLACHDGDFHIGAPGQLGHSHRRPRRVVPLLKVASVDHVHLRIVIHVFEIDRCADDVGGVEAFTSQNAVNVIEDLPCLAFDTLILQLTRFLIDRNLSGDEEEMSNPDGRTVRSYDPDRGNHPALHGPAHFLMDHPTHILFPGTTTPHETGETDRNILPDHFSPWR